MKSGENHYSFSISLWFALRHYFFAEKNEAIQKMISIPISEIYAQVVKSATSYHSLIVLPLTNFTLHPLTCCVIDKGIKGLV